MPVQRFFLGNTFLGESVRPLVLVHGNYQPPPSIAYFCSECGDIWARIVVSGQPFMVYTMPCEHHASPNRFFALPGSMVLLWDRELTESFPPALVEREFNICMEHL